MAKPVIAVIGGSGRQGGGVVDALLASGKFTVRVVSRDPVGAAAKALNKRGVEVIKATCSTLPACVCRLRARTVPLWSRTFGIPRRCTARQRSAAQRCGRRTPRG